MHLFRNASFSDFKELLVRRDLHSKQLNALQVQPGGFFLYNKRFVKGRLRSYA